MKKHPCKKHKIRKKFFNKQEKLWTYLKIFWKKRKDFKANWVVLAHSKPKIFFLGQSWADIYMRPCPSPLNYFSAATALLS